MTAYLDIETTYDGALSMQPKKPILIEIKQNGKFYDIEYSDEILRDFWSLYSRLNYPVLAAHNGVRFDYKFLLSGLDKKPMIRTIGSQERPFGLAFEYAGRHIQWIDTYPKTMARLEQIGNVVGIPKGKLIEYKSDEKIDVNSKKYDELKKYCKNDVNILEAHERFFPDGIKLRNSLASTSFHHLFNVRDIKRITNASLDCGNRGALVECYVPELKDAVMLDGNSMYGWAMQKLASPYAYPHETKDRDRNMMGLYYVEISKSNDEHPFIGIYSKVEYGCAPIPRHFPIGILKYPNFNNCRLWLSSGDLDGLESEGYDYTIILGYEVPALDLTEKIGSLFDMRISRDEYNISCKLLIAAGYGKFAQRDVKPHKYEIYEDKFVSIGKKMIDKQATKAEIDAFDNYLAANVTGAHGEYVMQFHEDYLTLIFVDEKICKHRNIITSANILGRARARLREWDRAAGLAAYVDADALIIPGDNLSSLKRYVGKHIGELKMQDEGDAEIYARKSYTFAAKTKCKGITNPSAKKTGKYTAVIYSDAPRDATFKEMMSGSPARLLDNRTMETDLRNYRKFDGNTSKPYELKNYAEPSDVKMQIGL